MKIVAILLAAIAFAAPCRAEDKALVPYVWNDVTGTRDMPWMGSGGRARWYKRDVTKPWDFMNPRGPTIETRWGSSGGSGEDPYGTGDRTVAYLERIGALKAWPSYPAAEGQPPRSAFPYRVTIVCIQPVVAILRFDLSAVIADPTEFSHGAFPLALREDSFDQQVSGGNIVNAVMFGTRVSNRGGLSWFSPDAQVPPTPLDLSSGKARIAVRGVTLEVERRGEEIAIRR